MDAPFVRTVCVTRYMKSLVHQPTFGRTAFLSACNFRPNLNSTPQDSADTTRTMCACMHVAKVQVLVAVLYFPPMRHDDSFINLARGSSGAPDRLHNGEAPQVSWATSMAAFLSLRIGATLPDVVGDSYTSQKGTSLPALSFDGCQICGCRCDQGPCFSSASPFVRYIFATANGDGC